MKKRCGGFQKWALRYLILDKNNRILYYYHSPKDASPKRSLDLNSCTISRLTHDESPKDPGFKVTQPGVRDYIFVGSNAAVVDDWVNAIFQAKTPSLSTTQSLLNGNGLSPSGTGASAVKSPTSNSDNFSYNGPTLAVLPNRSSTAPSPESLAMSPQARSSAPKPMQPSPLSPQKQAVPPSNRSTQSSVNEGNNTTLVGNGGGDTNSTLVAAGGATGGGQKSKIPVGQPVPVLILTPDNKKFSAIEKPVVGIIKVGRFVGGNQPQSEDLITFKSKVISRHHAEIWAVNHEVYLRDTRSQSGTFLNAMRLSEPSKESKPYRLKPGDVIQFGVDYKGATEDNARCISVRVDLKMKVLEPAPSAGMAQSGSTTGEREETLVGQNTEGATLVGGGSRAGTKTNMSEKTLVGQGQQDGTLYGNDQPVPPMPIPSIRPNYQMQQQPMGGMPPQGAIGMMPRIPQNGPVGMMPPGGMVPMGMRPQPNMVVGMRPPGQVPQMMPGMQR